MIWRETMIKSIIISTLLFVSFGVLASKNDLLSISLDKEYYFHDFSESNFSIKVSNLGTGLAYIDVQMFLGNLLIKDNENNQLKFDVSQRMLEYDIYPSTVLVPPRQERVIKIIRADEHESDVKEKFYRIRVIPVSPVELLKNNQALWERLNIEQRAELQHELEHGKGVFNLSVGSGSILTVQPRSKINFNAVSLINDKVGFSLKNTGMYTIKLSSLVLYSGNNQPMYFDNVILKPNDIKRIRSFRKLSLDKKFVPVRMSYVNQYGDKVHLEL